MDPKCTSVTLAEQQPQCIWHEPPPTMKEPMLYLWLLLCSAASSYIRDERRLPWHFRTSINEPTPGHSFFEV